jgi:dihydrodipicolinate synthase/N-acetylneuraminate lyase
VSASGLERVVGEALRGGLVIPACPLALTESRRLDERRQRGLVRYYAEAGAGGLAVGVHTTQFAIRDPKHGLWGPVLELVGEELGRADRGRAVGLVRIVGICGQTAQAVAEASRARQLGYQAGLVSLAALGSVDDDGLIAHCRVVGEVLPVVGFYLQPAVGGRVLSYRFWRRFFELEAVVAVKIAPFDRYKTIDVVRAVIDAGRDDVALYTGNDDAIVLDLVTPYRLGGVERRMVGGLLGQWAVGTRAAVRLLERCRAVAAAGEAVPAELLRAGVELTDLNGALFDAANGFKGCIAGIHEVLRRQGLMAGRWCLDPGEDLSAGQADEIDRVVSAYPHWTDDAFVREHRDRWLAG